MAGRPQLVAKGAKEPRQRIWESIRILAPGFSSNDIARRSGLLPTDIRKYLKLLVLAGIIRQIEPRSGLRGACVYELIKDEGVDHPRLDNKGQRTYSHLITENIWRTLRILKGELSVSTVTQAATAGGATMTMIVVRQYLNALAEAGYLVKSKGDKNGDLFRLISEKYTGPRPPEIRRLDSLQVYDPNMNKLIYAKTTGSIAGDRSLVEPGIALLRTRDLLGEWLALTEGGKETVKPSSDLVQRTQLELASTGDSGGLQ